MSVWERKIRSIKNQKREVLVQKYRNVNGERRERVRMVYPKRGNHPQMSRYKIVDKRQGQEEGRFWFNPQDDLSGWEKTQSSATRMHHIQEEINERMQERKMTRREAQLSVARALQALSNVTRDSATKRKARKDARILFEQLRKE